MKFKISSNKKSSITEEISVSAEGIEYHPPCGDTQQKILMLRILVSAEGIE